MATQLDAAWREMRGMEIQAVGIASVSYDEESKKLINMRNQGAMLGDASVREGYIQGAMARGFEAAGSNSGGSATAFMGMLSLDYSRPVQVVAHCSEEEFAQFRQGFRGDARQQVQELLNSGKMTQAQYDSLSAIARQIMPMLR